MTVLGIELRRSAALGAGLITVVVGVGALYLATGRWSSGWMALAMTVREYLLLLWPLALAAGAWQGRREHRAKVGELFTTTARPRAQRMLPVLGAMALTLTVAYLLVTVAGIGWIASTARHVPLLNFAVVTGVGAMSLIGAAWLGLGIGRMLPALVTAPALAVAGVLLIFLSVIRLPDWLAAAVSPVHGTLPFHAYQTIDNRVSAALAISMAALATAGMLLFVADGWRTRTAALVPVVLGLLVATAVVPRDEGVLNWPVDPVARELLCTDDTPTVCVSRVNANVLDALTPLAREGLTALAKLPDAPTAVYEDTRTFMTDEVSSPEDGVVRIQVRIDKRGGLAHPAAVVPEIVRGLGVQYDGRCENRNEVVERAAAYWLLEREPRSDVGVVPGMIEEDPEINPAAVALWQGLRALPEDEALARVTAVRDALRTCADVTGILSGAAR
ncbi:hypothetical protein ACN26Z_05120 [Verrucosispora sp. WMMD703]|uniref:Uncharacterized protein n=1 Tax=Micromonospora sediminimaris TaxID=547162 RepID=A0A9W5USG7_9ACTN|nr:MULTISPECIES: hypothetical protein [Micromonospora]MBQ1049903.1 hypothetical protein [Micromonospora sp. C51]WFE45147.1 hypothetical protein O7624_12750 [Verrucosispora sp. WMMD1129]GIJ32445.1 hypothetical protein Vse01_15930 [Micromonospora sediminimaris]SFD35415.1 hypothetical protein SAMN05216284_115132 [Micromonospora sediminimaris]